MFIQIKRIIYLQPEYAGLRKQRRRRRKEIEKGRKVGTSNLRATKKKKKEKVKRMIVNKVNKHWFKIKKEEGKNLVWAKEKKKKAKAILTYEMKIGEKKNKTRAEITKIKELWACFFILFLLNCIVLVLFVLFSMYSCSCHRKMTNVSVR